MSMSKGFALVLVLVFLTASCVMVAKPVSGASAVENTWVSKAPMQVAIACYLFQDKCLLSWMR
ncbi:MAG: hypothetical protein ABSC20_12185 [Candidatus Bathyarchaeia archaeon]|jgi:hypothetical protein